MFARFDDLRPHRRRSFQLSDPIAILSATGLSEVPVVLDAAAQAVEQNRWVAGFVSYEAAPAFDDSLVVRDVRGTDVADLPLAWFAVFERRAPATGGAGSYRLNGWEPSTDEAHHHAAITAIREHIRQGRTYQVNHTFRLEAPFSGDATGLYQDLASSQTCGYGSYIDAGRWAIASASPELFFEWRHDRIVSRPMKGTISRGTTLSDDEERRRELLTSEKNRAENLMIVDMVRNDLGRISRLGSVRVPELFSTEKYDTVWQMTSTVVGQPVPGVSLTDVFGALFPCASITGAPKVATMEIIADLETTPRGVYCGTVGFGGPGPSGPEWAFNVAIRTVLIDRRSGRAIYGTGGGITYDSTPGDEYAEALLKTEVLERRTADLSLIETMRWDPGSGFYELARHLSRLSDSAWYFDVPFDPAEVRSTLDRATRGADHGLKVRLLVDRTGWMTVDTEPLPDTEREEVALAIDRVPIDPRDPFLHHKTTNRTVYRRAAERFPDADDVVLVNADGHVTETTIANLAIQIRGEWLTPPKSDGLLGGVQRAALIDRGDLIERSVTVEELRGADAIARINAVRGWEPARLIDDTADR
jgi:para-aminobenzoate synthetase/4-amino-4-deoxychorismate lyase